MTDNNAETQNWKEERKKIVGASEISAVIRATSSVEDIEKAMGGSSQDFIDSKDFVTSYELYHLKKGTLDSKPFPEVLSEFGHKMEKFGEMWLNRTHSEHMKVECQPQKVLNSTLHKLAGYTPDLFADFLKDGNFRDREIKNGDKGLVEVKTTGYFQAKKDNLNEEGSKWSYIQQVQYGGMQEKARDGNYKWTVLLHIIPLQAEFDNDFTKGKACMCCDNIERGGYEWLLKHYDVNFWIFPVFEVLHPLFLNALNVWDNMLQNDIEPEPDFLRDCSIVSKLFKNNIPEIISSCKIKYDINDGCIPISRLENNTVNIYDEAKIFYEKSSEYKRLGDEIKADKTKWFMFFKNTGVLGIDDERFTLKVALSGSGVTVKCNFKNSEEMQSGKTASDKF